MNKNLFFSILIFLPLVTLSQKRTLLIGGTAYVGNGDKIENSVICIEGEKIDFVANSSEIKIDPTAFDTIIRLHGKFIYPSFILPNSRLGITEIDAVRATHDFREVGSFNPHVRTKIAYNTDSKIIGTLRTNGILVSQVAPIGGLFSGQSSVFYLDGNNWENAVCKSDDGIHLNWPRSYNKSGWWAEPGESKRNKEYQQKVLKIEDYLDKASSYFNNNGEKIDIKMESMKGLFDGSKNLYVHADYYTEIIDAIDLLKKKKIKKIVLVGGEEVLMAKNIIKNNNINVILNRVHRLPSKVGSSIYEPYTQAKLLHENEILFCFSYEGDMEVMGSRNLPFTAGTSVAYGLDYNIAIKSLTMNAAKILGIDNRLGSLEAGKEATFFISDGDALDIMSNNLFLAYIRGKTIKLTNHQTELYEKFK